jgi:hypothetical protein
MGLAQDPSMARAEEQPVRIRFRESGRIVVDEQRERFSTVARSVRGDLREKIGVSRQIAE